MDILLLLFISWAITNILVNGSLLDRIRDYSMVKIKPLGKLLSCVMCSGFWVGIIIYSFLLTFENSIAVSMDILYYNKPFANLLVFGFISSGFSVLVNSLIIYFMKK